MKKIIILLLCLLSLSVFGQRSNIHRDHYPQKHIVHRYIKGHCADRFSFVYTTRRRYHIGYRPLISYDIIYIIDNYVIYWYSDGSYSLEIGGPIVGYFDPLN